MTTGHSSVCINIASHIDPRYGGIASSLPALCEAMEKGGRYSSPLAAFCHEAEHSPNGAEFGFKRFSPNRMQWIVNRNLRKDFDEFAQNSSLLHIHGLWETHSAVAAGWARKNKRPYLVSAHGMLDPWALRQKRWKKKMYSFLVEQSNLTNAACLRAITMSEAMQYRAFGLSNPIAVIPNGVEVPEDVSPEPFWEQYPHLRKKAVILFLGRLHPKKGLLPLCLAWSKVSGEFPEAHLVIAGPDCDGMENQLRTIVERQNASGSVSFIGSVYGAMKWSTYAAASAFVLPSFSEGFSVAVLEALGMGTPVIISEACYFPEALEAGAGWLTGTSESEIVAAITAALTQRHEDRTRMGDNGVKLVRERYSWPRIASQLTEVHDWLLGGSHPASIKIV